MATYYEMGEYDLQLMIGYGVMHRVRGVMFRPRESDKTGSYSYDVDGDEDDESIVLQDGFGDCYYFYQELTGGETFVAPLAGDVTRRTCSLNHSQTHDQIM